MAQSQKTRRDSMPTDKHKISDTLEMADRDGGGNAPLQSGGSSAPVAEDPPTTISAKNDEPFNAQAYRIQPTHGPTFLIGGVF